ncbi:MAG: porin [Betaproteobacteria bacterium]|jgi:predicted porin|nr:porin [Betaproteobacteria bacterium]
MKKTLLSLALFGAFSGAAMAADNVQLYGIVDLGVQHLSYDNTTVNRLGSGIQSGSRIGLKGTEDLGGGLAAMFQLETGFCANGNNTSAYTGAGQGAQNQAGGSYCTSGSTFMGRTSMVGLTGGFGTVALGRMYSPFFNAAATYDPFGAGLTGSITNLDPGSLDYVRVSQTMAYMTPTFAGFQGTVAYGFGGQPGNNSNGRAYNLALTYDNGPISGGVTYLQHNFTSAAYTNGGLSTQTGVNTQNLMLDSTARGFTPTDGYFKNKLWNIYGAYDFGVAKLGAYYAQEKFGDGAVMVGGGQNPNLKIWSLGLTVPVGAGAVLASYGQRKDSNLDNSTVKQVAIGYTYALSKRTNLYTSYAHITNQSNVDQYVGDATIAGSGLMGGQSSSGFALGIRHKF